MMQSPKPNDRLTILPNSPAILLLVTIADTTWRMFLPTIIGTLIGVGLDNLFDNKRPWFTIVMVIIGSFISALLVAMQFRKLRAK